MKMKQKESLHWTKAKPSSKFSLGNLPSPGTTPPTLKKDMRYWKTTVKNAKTACQSNQTKHNLILAQLFQMINEVKEGRNQYEVRKSYNDSKNQGFREILQDTLLTIATVKRLLAEHKKKRKEQAQNARDNSSKSKNGSSEVGVWQVAQIGENGNKLRLVLAKSPKGRLSTLASNGRKYEPEGKIKEKEAQVQSFREKLRQNLPCRQETRTEVHGRMKNLPRTCMCGMEFRFKIHCTRHIAEKVNGAIKCDVEGCNHGDALKADMENHRRKVHPGHPVFVCDSCSCFFKFRQDRDAHQKNEQCRRPRIKTEVPYKAYRDPEYEYTAPAFTDDDNVNVKIEQHTDDDDSDDDL